VGEGCRYLVPCILQPCDRWLLQLQPRSIGSLQTDWLDTSGCMIITRNTVTRNQTIKRLLIITQPVNHLCRFFLQLVNSDGVALQSAGYQQQLLAMIVDIVLDTKQRLWRHTSNVLTHTLLSLYVLAASRADTHTHTHTHTTTCYARIQYCAHVVPCTEYNKWIMHEKLESAQGWIAQPAAPDRHPDGQTNKGRTDRHTKNNTASTSAGCNHWERMTIDPASGITHRLCLPVSWHRNW